MSILNVLEKYLNESGMFHPIGSGETINVEGEITLPQSEKHKYSKFMSLVTKNKYFETIDELLDPIFHGLGGLGLTPVIGDEKWVGTFSGSPQYEISERITIDLVKDNKMVTNSKLILNIYKMSSGRYELVTYLS